MKAKDLIEHFCFHAFANLVIFRHYLFNYIQV